MKKRLLTGLQPSGELTIGNYIGSIRQVANYQDEYETFLFVPDMHSITVPQDPETFPDVTLPAGLFEGGPSPADPDPLTTTTTTRG